MRGDRGPGLLSDMDAVHSVQDRGFSRNGDGEGGWEKTEKGKWFNYVWRGLGDGDGKMGSSRAANSPCLSWHRSTMRETEQRWVELVFVFGKWSPTGRTRRFLDEKKVRVPISHKLTH
jgi:hypothetical protein